MLNLFRGEGVMYSGISFISISDSIFYFNYCFIWLYDITDLFAEAMFIAMYCNLKFEFRFGGDSHSKITKISNFNEQSGFKILSPIGSQISSHFICIILVFRF